MTASESADEGLFLRHLNRGKHLYGRRRYPEAERELEEACLLRPRDLEVLNLLGLSYFKQEKYLKAEEVYRKLVAESPDAHTLHYNLGLIYLKLGRLSESEQSFLRAQQLSDANPKISFYLGALYERMGRLQDSIYQYRHAGAHIMVRRVQGQFETPAGDDVAEDVPSGPSTDPEGIPAAAEAAAPRASEPVSEAGEVTAGSEPAAGGDRRVGPISPGLMAPEPPREEEDKPSSRTLPPSVTLPGLKVSEVLAALGAQPGMTGARLNETFRLLRAGLLEVVFSGKVFIKQGTVYSYSGKLTFWVKEKRPGGRPVLVIVSGKGRIVLTDRDREISLLPVGDEPVYVEPDHVLACEESLTPRYVTMSEGDDDPLEFLTFDGRGALALSATGRALSMPVTPEMPVSVPAGSVIAWSGSLSARLAEDRAEVEPLLFGPGRDASLLRLEGTGKVLVERIG